MSKKRPIESYFTSSASKKRRDAQDEDQDPVRPFAVSQRSLANSPAQTGVSSHETYSFPIANLPARIGKELESLPARPPREMNDQPDLDLLYFQPYMPNDTAKELFEFLRSSLPFYRVTYTIKRGGTAVEVRTPR